MSARIIAPVPIWNSFGISKEQPKNKTRVDNSQLARLVTFDIISILVLSQFALLLQPILGVYANATALLLLMTLAITTQRARKLAIAASIVPVAIIVSLALPQYNPLGQSQVLYDAMLIPALAYYFIFNKSKPTKRIIMSAKEYAFTFPIFIVAGQLLGILSFVSLRNHYAFRNVSLPVILVSLVIFAITEEVLFRGLIQKRASQIMRPALSIILAASLYAALSITLDNMLATCFALLSGLVLSTMYYFKPNLFFTISANITMKLLFVGLVLTFH